MNGTLSISAKSEKNNVIYIVYSYFSHCISIKQLILVSIRHLITNILLDKTFMYYFSNIL